MIKSFNLTEFVPGTEQLLFPYSAEEFLLLRGEKENVIKQSLVARAFYLDDQLLCYGGIIRQSLFSPPMLWILLGRNFSAKTARPMRKVMRDFAAKYPGAQTIIEKDYIPGERLARFYGLRPLEKTISLFGRQFTYYEVQ